MGAFSDIEWTGRTLNPYPWRCKPLSPGCDFCYAQTWTDRWQGQGAFTSGVPHLIPGKLLLPLLDATFRQPDKMFLTSMSDPFHPALRVEEHALVWAMMAATPHHVHQVLTRRPAVMRKHLASDAFPEQVMAAFAQLVKLVRDLGRLTPLRRAALEQIEAAQQAFTYPLDNVWLGISAEAQVFLNQRIADLLATPAEVRWLSAEPLLGGLDLSRVNPFRRYPDVVWNLLERRAGTAQGRDGELNAGLDWVVVGGESGSRTQRPMHPAWAADLRDQCAAASTPIAYFFKQWGAYGLADEHEQGTLRYIDRDGRSWGQRDFPEVLGPDPVAMRRVGKKRAGRLLNGRLWHDFPATRSTGREAAA